jgi:Mor family transcriptional regulator
MPYARKITVEQHAEICQQYLAGDSSTTLAKRYGVCDSTISNVLRRNGVTTRTAKERNGALTDEQEAELCRRYVEGEHTRKLAKAYGVYPGTVWLIIRRNGVKTRSIKEVRGGLTNEQEIEVCHKYSAGMSTVQLGKAYKVTSTTISNILSRNGVKHRSISEAKRQFTDAEELEFCRLYDAGETTVEIAKLFGVTGNTIADAVQRQGGEIRCIENWTDSVKHVLDGTGRHSRPRECEFYLYELARYADTHCKPGIAFETETRVKQGSGKYGEEVLRLVFGTRAEAYFLEQAVLDATRGYRDCPEDLAGWSGATEVRAMPAEDLLPVVDRLAAELELLGVWEFAAAYVPMTAAQRAQCQQRARLSPVPCQLPS